MYAYITFFNQIIMRRSYPAYFFDIPFTGYYILQTYKLFYITRIVLRFIIPGIEVFFGFTFKKN